MKDELKENLKRLERLVEIRQTYVSVAEAGVKQAEGEVRRLQAAEREITGHIQHNQALIAYLKTAKGHDVQTQATYIRALETQRKLIMQSLDTATTNLEGRRREWTEAMREEKVAVKLRERRLQQWEREADAAQQKSQDDTSVARFARTRLEK